MPDQGYYRQPTIHQDTVVFVSEDDLWQVPATGGKAERLTAGLGRTASPAFSPDGKSIAFLGHEEGPSDIFTVPAGGGAVFRLTYQGGAREFVTWTPDAREVVYAAVTGQPFTRMTVLFRVSSIGEPGLPASLPFGPSSCIVYLPNNGMVLGRNTSDPARWKRYRGGMVGELWIDSDGRGEFSRLVRLGGNLASPCSIGDRVYFLSDHEGVGNVYSCLINGEDVRRHSNHDEFYARHLSSDGRRLAYHAGADLYLLDPSGNQSARITVEYPGSRTQRARKFVPAADYLDTYDPSADGASLVITTRGKGFTLGNWAGPVEQFGEQDGIRYRLARHLAGNAGVLVVSDAGEVETLEILAPDEAAPRRLEGLDLGRVVELELSPDGTQAALTNHRQELIAVDLAAGRMRVLDRSLFDVIISRRGSLSGIAWSPDSRWLAYGCAQTSVTSAIKLCEVATGATHTVTDPVLRDDAPAFDPDGRYLYFLGQRILDPVYDETQYEIDFPKGSRPYALTLQADQLSPFLPSLKSPAADPARAKETAADHGETPPTAELRIDLEGIQRRVVPFPAPEGRYERIAGIKGKALFTSVPVEGQLNTSPFDSLSAANATLESYDFEKQKLETLATGISDFRLSGDLRTLAYRAGRRLRVLQAGVKVPEPSSDGNTPSRDTGWIDLERVKVSVHPTQEWRQMFGEMWRLQRDQFWTPDMSGVDWDGVYRRYRPLVDRVTTRSELSDLFWEVQGELGTSHAYEFGGEYRPAPEYHHGYLGVDWNYDPEHGAYRVGAVVQGDPSEERTATPLTAPGVNVRVGDRVVAINGQTVRPDRGPQSLLVNTAGQEVLLTVADRDGGNKRSVRVTTLRDERSARYRDWVEAHRRAVHEATNDRVGYVHIPDMGAEGYSEFHRLYLTEYDHEALIVDVRWNGGGYASALILEKLARRRRAYSYARWGGSTPYPEQSPRGPLVMLTNEQAGSDGDIVSHAFKMMRRGPLIGKRTWGGVIGITPRHALVDNTITTQPEYAFCFDDVGWGVENYGTDPDIDLDFTPQDYAAGRDPQLTRGIEEAQRLLELHPAHTPQPPPRPWLARAPLPPAR